MKHLDCELGYEIGYEEGIFIIKNPTFARLNQMAVEEKMPAREMLEELIYKEDTRRHVIMHPYSGAERFKCDNPNCREERSRKK